MQLLEMEVTPQQAREWLGQQRTNRPTSGITIARYARMMREGSWKSRTNEAIAFDEEGKLLDGQHRLMAVLSHGQPVKMAVAFGCASHIGIARTRSIQHVAAIEYGQKIPRNTSAIIRVMRGNEDLTPREVVRAYNKYQPGIDFAVKHIGRADDNHVGVAPVQAAIACAFYHMEDERLQNFCKALRTGIMQFTIDANAVKLARLLQKAAISKRASSLTPLDQFRCAQYALYRYGEGVVLKTIKNPERDLFALPQ